MPLMSVQRVAPMREVLIILTHSACKSGPDKMGCSHRAIYSSMDAAQPCGDAEGKDWRLMARKQGDVPVIGILTIDDNE